MREKTKKREKIVESGGFFPSEKRWLYYKRFCSVGKVKGEILGIHGAAEHSGRYIELGRRLASEGYNFYILDLTGHGKSENLSFFPSSRNYSKVYGKKEGVRGYINKFEDYIVDVSNFYAFLKTYKNMGTPFIFGHSMGGLIASLFSIWGRCKVKGLILSGPLFKLKAKVPFFKYSIVKILSIIYPICCFKDQLDPFLLTHDIEIIKKYITDPFVNKTLNVRWFIEIIKAMKKVYISAPALNIPCIIFHGENDKIVDIEGSREFFKRISSKNKEFYIVKEAYHEVFNEIGRERLISILIKWLNLNS